MRTSLAKRDFQFVDLHLGRHKLGALRFHGCCTSNVPPLMNFAPRNFLKFLYFLEYFRSFNPCALLRTETTPLTTHIAPAKTVVTEALLFTTAMGPFRFTKLHTVPSLGRPFLPHAPLCSAQR